jgi:hypothetical protein
MFFAAGGGDAATEAAALARAVSAEAETLAVVAAVVAQQAALREAQPAALVLVGWALALWDSGRALVLASGRERRLPAGCRPW